MQQVHDLKRLIMFQEVKTNDECKESYLLDSRQFEYFANHWQMFCDNNQVWYEISEEIHEAEYLYEESKLWPALIRISMCTSCFEIKIARDHFMITRNIPKKNSAVP